LPGFNAFTAGDVNTKTWSLFADFTYDFTDSGPCLWVDGIPRTSVLQIF
jgi:hypothetical protein